MCEAKNMVRELRIEVMRRDNDEHSSVGHGDLTHN